MPSDRVPKHKQRLATDSQGKQHKPSLSAQPAPREVDKDRFEAQQNPKPTSPDAIKRGAESTAKDQEGKEGKES